ncbi:MAG: ACT domain-containing protein [Solirubrobacterales bacterium]|nr:ACT domain-containing protein [Solirubrobacterales bacterium]HMT05493.1 ACT domain-containing protein [Solirubrobacterales bacterium]
MNLAVTAIGRDRPGIVAAITAALLDAGGNVDDSQMSILHGHFAVMLIVSLPGDTHLESLEARLEDVGREFELGGITLSPVESLNRGAAPTHVLTVYGADRPGIVHDTAAALASLNVNITDLRTRRTGSSDAALYTLMVEVAVPAGVENDLDLALNGLRDSKQVEARLAELDSGVF